MSLLHRETGMSRHNANAMTKAGRIPGMVEANPTASGEDSRV